MNVLQNALMDGLATEVLTQTAPELPILSGDVIALSNYGKGMYDAGISWTNYSMTANFIREQDAPFLVTEVGTCQIIEEPRPLFIPIHTEACRVAFNNLAFKRMTAQGTIIDWYKQELVAKVQAWDARVANLILYGSPSVGIPGLLQGSGIPMISSTVNLSTAPIDTVINEVIRIALTPAKNSLYVYKPNKIAMPSDLFDILNTRSYSTTGATIETVLDVIIKRLMTSAGYNKPGDPTWVITAVPQFNTNKLMTILPSSADEIGAAVWDLESFTSIMNTEGMDDSAQIVASSHRGGIAGVIVKRPLSGLISTVTY